MPKWDSYAPYRGEYGVVRTVGRVPFALIAVRAEGFGRVPTGVVGVARLGGGRLDVGKRDEVVVGSGQFEPPLVAGQVLAAQLAPGANCADPAEDLPDRLRLH